MGHDRKDSHAEHAGDWSNEVIGCAIRVHSALGPGSLESVYEQCMAVEMEAFGIPFKRQEPISVVYRDRIIECAYRADFVVGGRLLLELKSVEQFLPIHEAQLLTYMRLARAQTGLLSNFNVTLLKEGLRRMVL